jgi:SAM-dependent methyltransferase
MSYSPFAKYYDSLTRNVDYSARADYFFKVLAFFGHKAGLTLDLACGTGSLTLKLAERNVDIFGLDASPEMLTVAQQKSAEAGRNLLFICQKMQQMDLYGTVDTVVCMLDSISHLTTVKDLQDTFGRVSLFLNPGGYFIFDANTVYKHRAILGHNVFVYDVGDVYCVWQNSCEKNNRVGITLDFFERRGQLYSRSSEHFYERAYETEFLSSLLKKAGLEVCAVWGDMSFESPPADAQRILVVAKKPE